MKICITVGHSILKNGACTSADGLVNEYQYNKLLAPILADIFRKKGHTVSVIICPEKQFSSKNEEKSYKIPKVNNGEYDLLIELHLNASDGQGKGSEVLYYSNKGLEYATRICNKLGMVFKNRGAKLDKGLYILNSSKPTAILIESFFCDNKEDYEKAEKLGYEGVAKLIVEGVLNNNINGGDIKQIKHTIVYSGDDRVSAEIIGLYYKRKDESCLVTDIKDYKPYKTENLYVIGGGACSKMEEMSKSTGEKFTQIYDSDVWSTMDKVRAFIKEKA
ncbi:MULTISPECIES: N-acetylmuramoyl-L-alanine amidase [unclassified Clostridioides]|uniref:N-acetylmuramoyl-L-alanine amidase n=1 Tax=unclassified Clostridioides TaxID=2635829 RepID=UPI001D0CA9A5|nr:N-acetylmuramoyl-L-alanine amidase [Clostridioides sp. ES-S-0001-02]MCC0640017.1 N-acetylmuramoyl-L-alanine amidase [Clostridioides sp. ES-S-0049-03]MCC0653773.1 N-acetylmuramoyl-L-alanine amidase [Clostridioides sp. ES-S-0001-03]MCC0670705.1 N-acetylmuramoyl-L-alanine amidase [Clostridioides sp. ES-S-0145-01]MCC0674763.1 N-acetylmuramoyl-L-alanine amidase [Clostridioides sp. ES-W-0018-02]MCC0679291.1 N-acetylmuramoyl-L-alanine amidase [Clostridioides sp. ES-S-0005-03]MCC0696376.1 N-acetyl